MNQANPLSRADWRKAIKKHLLNLTSPLQVDTVTAILERRINGQSWDTADFWKQPNTCSRATFNKWKKYDPKFEITLDATWEIVREYRAGAAADAINEAVLSLQLSTPAFVRTVIKIANSQDEDVALRASFGGLDRASKLTANKADITLSPDVKAVMDKVYGPETGDEEPDAAAKEEEE